MNNNNNSVLDILGGKPIYVLALAAAIFISWQGVMAVPIQIGSLIRGLGFSEQRSSFLGTLEITTMALVPILLALRIGRWSKPHVAIFGAVLVIAGQALSSVATNFPLLAGCRLAVGAGAGFIYGAACAAIAGHPRGDQMLAWGIALGQTALAAMLVTLPFTAQFGQQSGVFLALAVLALAFAPLLMKMPESLVRHGDEDTNRDSNMVSRGFLFFFFLALTCFNVGIGMMWGFLELRADELHLEPAAIGMVLAALPLGGVIGSGIAGLIGHRFGRMLPFCVALTSCTAACFTVALVEVELLLLISTFALGIFELFVMAFFIGTASSMDSRGRIATIAGGMTMLTYGLGPGLGGLLAYQLSASEIIIASGMICLAAAAIILPVSILLDRRGNAKSVDVAEAATPA